MLRSDPTGTEHATSGSPSVTCVGAGRRPTCSIVTTAGSDAPRAKGRTSPGRPADGRAVLWADPRTAPGSLRCGHGDETPSARCGPNREPRALPRASGGTGSSSLPWCRRRCSRGCCATTWCGGRCRLLLGVALPWTLLWRRTHPLAVVEVAFGADHPGRHRQPGRRRRRGGGPLHDGLRRAVSLLAGALGERPGDRRSVWRSSRCTAILGIAIDYTGIVDSVAGIPLPALPGNAGRDGALLDVVPAARARPGQAPGARAAGPRAARHGRAPRLRHRHPRPGGPGRRRDPPGGRAGRPRRDRGGGVADAGRAAHHGRRSARRRRRPRSPRSRGWPTSSGSPGAWATCPRVEVDLSGTSTTSDPRSGRRSTASPRSR